MLTKNFFWRSETVASRKKFGPAIHSNTIMPTLQSLASNGITTTFL